MNFFTIYFLQFFIIFNLAVGGTNGFFPDDATNDPKPKPWKNSAPHVRNNYLFFLNFFLVVLKQK